MTPAICVKCGHRDKYETNRETRLSDLLCKHCGTGRLVQAGKNPSHAARDVMRRMGEVVDEPIVWRTQLSVAEIPDIECTAQIEHPPDSKKGGFAWELQFHGKGHPERRWWENTRTGTAKSFADARSKVEDQVRELRGKKP